MKPISTISLLTASLACCPTALAQRDFSNVQMKATHVAGAVYMLEGSGGNIGVSVGPDGVLIIDDQFAPLADKIRAAIARIVKEDEKRVGKLKFVLNTHHHGDHTGGNVEFGREAPIIAHDNVRKRLSGELRGGRGSGRPTPKEGLPVITFGDSLSMHFNGEELRVIHHPHAHTDGDSVIYFTKSNVVHMGDLFFAGRFPFADLESGGDVMGLTQSIERILDKLPPGVKIIPGHGPLSDADDLRSYHRMLVETTDIVRARIRDKRSLDQIKEAGLPAKWKGWGEGFINTDGWLESIYKSLRRANEKPPTG